MTSEMTEREQQIYRETATVYEFARDLFEAGKLSVETVDDALSLGEAHFAEKCKRGEFPEDWRDVAYGDLLA